MNITRKEAEKNYKDAISDMHSASYGTSPAAYDEARDRADKCRTILVNAEIMYPTKKELHRANNTLRLRNRGLDI